LPLLSPSAVVSARFLPPSGDARVLDAASLGDFLIPLRGSRPRLDARSALLVPTPSRATVVTPRAKRQGTLEITGRREPSGTDVFLFSVNLEGETYLLVPEGAADAGARTVRLTKEEGVMLQTLLGVATK
jgi:hypothetical protein